MKKLIGILTVLFIVLIGIPVKAAAEMMLSAKVSGALEPGAEVEISIYASNVKSLYSGDIQFRIDDSVLKITGIEKGSLLNKKEIGFFEQKTLPEDNKVAKNIARYIFTALGKNDGYSGEGTLVIFKAKVLKKTDLYINAKALEKSLSNNYNMKIDLVSTDIKFMIYEFTPYGKASSITKPTPNESGGSKDAPVVQQPSNPKGNTETGSTGGKSEGDNGTTDPSGGISDPNAGQGGSVGSGSTNGQSETGADDNPSKEPVDGTNGQNNSADENDKPVGNTTDDETPNNDKETEENKSGNNNKDKKPSKTAENSKDKDTKSDNDKLKKDNDGFKIIGLLLIILAVAGAAVALWYFQLRHRFKR